MHVSPFRGCTCMFGCSTVDGWGISIPEPPHSLDPSLLSNQIPYMWKFSLDKSFANPSYLCIKVHGTNFCQCSKDHHILELYATFNTGQKNSHDKIFANESRWQNWWKFSPGENFYVYVNIKFKMYMLWILVQN